MESKEKDYPSGNGERAAQIGYYPQYCIAADKVYQGLLEGTFKSLSITDPSAGAVDDILIFSTNRIDAYQVKWTEQQGYLSFKDFIRGSTGADSLFGTLAYGWKIITEKYHNSNTFVHLIEHNLPNSNKNAKVEIENYIFDGTFYQFLSLWNNKTLLNIEKTNILFNKLSEYIGLNTSLFNDFYQHSFFHFGFSNPLEIPFEQTQKQEDCINLFHLINQCAGGQTRIINISKDDLIKKLNWINRFELQFSHEFPNPVKYEPIQTTITEIKTTIDKITSGYIALTGAPGSGKSTTLSQFFIENKSFCYVPYYAFIPDKYFSGIRGESSAFFSDISLQLERWGFKGNIGIIPKNIHDLKKKFGKQLLEAHEKYKNNKIKTIILIDGLDHIVREQNPHISLLKELLPPENIPDGVIIVLGTQTLQLNDIHPTIRNQLNKNGRTLIINSLTKIQTYNLINMYGFSQLSEKDKEIIFQKTTGHPLFLTYTLQLIKEKGNISCLDQYDNYIESIENMYICSWEQIKMNQNIIDILGIISRFRLPFDPESFLRFSPRNDLMLFIEIFSHYFKKGKSWSFYHNSFRQFLLHKTKETPFGKQDEKLDKDYYKRLSEILSETDNEIARWELLYTLFHADEKQKILEIATQSYFREQYFKLRSYKEIKNDISILLQISKINLNFNILLRCLLIEKELHDREQVLEEIDIISLLYNTHGISALFSLIQNPETNFDTTIYFQIASYLYQNNYIEEAKAIYEQHIPIEYLSGNVLYPFNYHDKNALLDSWVEIALLFELISEIVNYIEQVKIDKNNFYGQNKINHTILHKHLIKVLSGELLKSNRADEITKFIEICKNNDNYLGIIFNMCLQIKHQRLFKDEEEFQKIIYLLIEDYSKKYILDDYELLRLAEFYLSNNEIEKCNRIVVNICQVKISDIDDYSKEFWFYKTIRLNRLLAELNIIELPNKIIPDPEDEHYLGNALYLRCIIVFSQYEGIINRGGKVGIYDFKKNVEYAIRLLQKPYNETSEWYSWYILERTFPEFYLYIIRVCSKIENYCLENLKDIFLKSWNSNTFWLLDTKRIIIEELIKKGISINDLLPVLNDIFEMGKNDLDASSRVSFYYKFINTFQRLKLNKDYYVLFRDLLQSSFAIYDRKDYQIQDWIFWLELFNGKNPEKASTDLDKFFCSLSILYNEKGGDNAEAIGKLFKLSASINPNKAFFILQWLFDKGSCDYTKSLTGFILGILSFDPNLFIECFLLWQKMIIPFDPSSSLDVINIFINLLYAKFTPEDIEKHIISLINIINTELIPTSRRKYLLTLKSVIMDNKQENSNIYELIEKSITIAPEKKESDYSQIVYIQKDFKDFNELNSYIENKYKEEHLDMNYIVTALLKNININEIETVKKMIKRDIFGVREIIAICKAYEKMVGKDIIEGILENHLGSIEPNGWSIQWSGAPRMQIYRELIRINKEKWKVIAFEDLINTYLNISRYTYSYIYDWEEINNVFDNKIEFFIEEYWNEMTQHIYELTDFKTNNEIPEYIINDDTSLSIIIKTIIYFLKLPVPDFQLKSHQTLFEIYKKNIDKNEIFDIIKDLLDGDDLVINKLLLLIDCLSDNNKKFGEYFITKLLDLAMNNNVSIRFQSRMLLLKLGINSPEIEYKPLPSSYSLYFTVNNINFEEKEVNAHDILPNANTIKDFLRIFDGDVRLLSEVTNIEYNTIAMRILTLVNKLEPEEMWNEQAERKLINWLNDINQKRRYHRPRIQIIKRALNIIIGEFIDANILPENYISFLSSSTVRCVNKYLSLVAPISLPLEYRNNPFTTEWKIDTHKNNKLWIENINFDMHKLVLNYDEKIVIGSYIINSYFEWGKPTQIDISSICLRDMADNIIDNDDLFLKINAPIYFSSDYYSRPFCNMPNSLTVFCYEISIDHCGVSWFAFNPVIAIEMNWKFDNSEKLFKWVDSYGKTMVESIYFKDGSLDFRPPNYDLFCSEGWLVLITREAIEQIFKKYDDLYKIDFSKRTYKDDKKEYEKSIFRKEKFFETANT